ncbi:methyltransferase family protein [Thermosporothrix hazakensis]|jgi:SAM-dependent methyltransferase|uniref:Methyltransferase family protein n=2 Tax=Thermosporothrix TaxID=768650 RepID=A0A326TX71_THEHA|nr:class I SAM-dependent methyltransferase [Thermosporothrix hazakensis]PZW21064.1 methyltransferase family protein [Thermosporothrix hazakensis]BBH88196.1 methyltransferase type 11 [Thermosporothrix sp. COM3]GCE46384.1 methyltransferase type 11 [Thermosporothrix hazakensis]
MEEEQRQLRASFNQKAELYDQARPGYPERLFDDMVAFAALPAQASILEIGPGTGQATLPLARRGYRIHAIELGQALAAVARRKLAAFPNVSIEVGAFEETPLAGSAYDLALAATAFHWLPQDLAYRKLAYALKPGGTLALFWHVHVQSEKSYDFFEAVDEIYMTQTPEKAKAGLRLPWPEEVPAPIKDEIERSGFFTGVEVRRYCWEESYSAESYVRLLDTYSDHLALPEAARKRLYRSIASLIRSRFHGQITKGYMAQLYLARRA